MKNPEKKRSLLTSFVFNGLLLIALGIFMLVRPETAQKTICIIVGAVLGLMGLAKGFFFFKKQENERSTAELLLAVLLFAAGIALLVASSFFAKYFYIVIGVILVFGALMMFIRAIQVRKEESSRFVTALAFAALTLIFAVIVCINPAAFANFITRLHGASLLVEGLGMIIVLRSMQKKAENEKETEKAKEKETEQAKEKKAKK